MANHHKKPIFFERRWLTVKEAGQILGLSKETVYRQIKSGNLPASKVGSNVRIDKLALEETMARNKYQAMK